MKSARFRPTCLIGLAFYLVGMAQPTITTQPKSQSVSLGANVTLTVRASGTSPFRYQSHRGDTAILGATGISLVLTNTQLAHAGAYSAVVTDAVGSSATTRAATLDVDPTFTKITAGSIVADREHSFACAWEDYDRDGFLDLFVANQSNEPNFLYRNTGNANAWLKVRCVGTVSHRSAIGAKVRVKAGIRGTTVEQWRELTGGDGRSGQTLIAHFGLGDATVIATLRIEWPSGIVQELHDVAPGRLLTVTEPARLEALGGGVLRIQSWRGMVFLVEASTDLEQWSPLTTVTNFTGTLEFTDPDAASQSRRFHRTVAR